MERAAGSTGAVIHPGASVRTVVVAVASNLIVAVAKGVAAALTGSAAMLAETTHSIADTCNEVLLYTGVRHGRRPADDPHPLGYGQARFFWSLLAAVGIFVIGGVLAIADGVQSLLDPKPLTDVPVGVAVLLFSAVLEGWSWRTAHRQLRADADSRRLDLGEYIAVSSDPTPTTVFLEDSAALIGVALALAALVLHLLTGSAVWDAVASLLIGLLLIVVACVLARHNGALLIDEAAPADVRDRLLQVVAEEAWVDKVAEFSAVYVGPKGPARARRRRSGRRDRPRRGHRSAAPEVAVAADGRRRGDHTGRPRRLSQAGRFRHPARRPHDSGGTHPRSLARTLGQVCRSPQVRAERSLPRTPPPTWVRTSAGTGVARSVAMGMRRVSWWLGLSSGGTTSAAS